MRRWNNKLQIACILLVVLYFTHLATAAGNSKLIRTFDLKSEFCDLKFQQLNSPLEGMAFVNENDLLVYAICREGVGLSLRDRFQKTDPFHLKAVIIDISTGAIKKRFDLPTHGYESGILVTHEGNLLIHRDNVLDLLDPEGKRLAGSLVNRTGLYDFIFVAASPISDLVSVVDFPDASETKPNGVAVLDSRNLQLLHQWHDDADVGNIASSPTMTVRTADHGSRLIMRGFSDSKWTEVMTGPERGIFSPTFLTDSEYASLDHAHDAVLIFKSTGEEAAKLKVLSPMSLNVSRDGRLFSTAWGAIRHFDPFTGHVADGETGVYLYDASSLQKIESIDLQPTLYFDFVVAISPHCTKLAIVDLLNVSIWEIPARQKP